MAAPTFVAEFETGWGDSTSPETTGTITALAGDVLVCGMIVEATGTAISGPPTGGSGVTWTARGNVAAGSFTQLRVWTAVVPSDQNFAVSIAEGTATNNWWGFNVLQFRDSDGVGAVPAAATGTGTAPTLSLTTTQANSAVVVFNGDWSSADGTSRAWRTGHGTFTEKTYFRDTSHYATYCGYHADAGAASAQAIGLTGPTQTWSLAGVEVLGTAGPPPPADLIEHLGTGTPVAGTTSITTAAYPVEWDDDSTALSEGRVKIICAVASNHATTEATEPTVSGFTQLGTLNGGGGVQGAGTGNRRLTFFEKTAAAGDDTTPTVSLATGNVMIAAFSAFQTTGAWDTTTVAFGAETTAGTSWSQACTTDPGFDDEDMAFLGFAVRDTTAFSAMGITATGATFGSVTEAQELSSETGNDISLAVGWADVTAGPSSAAPTITATISTSETGVVGVVRLRASSGASFDRPVTDTASATDAVTRTQAKPRATGTTAAATDAVTRTSARPRATAETAAAVDTITTRTLTQPRATAESAAATDVAAKSAQAFTRTAADTAAATDAAVGFVTVARTAADTASATDAVTRSSTRPRATADSAPAVDTVAVTKAVSKAVSDSTPAVDTAVGTLALARAASDTAPATDAVTGTAARSRTATDTAAATDAVTRAFHAAGTAADSAPAVDDVTYETPGSVRSVDDSAPATDAVTTAPQAFTRAASDTAAAVDTVVATSAVSRTADDSAPATDAVTRTSNRPRAASESAPATDAVTTGAQAFTRTAPDSAPATDVATGTSTHSRTASDTAPAVDATTSTLAQSRSATDTAAADDDLTAFPSQNRPVSDSAPATDEQAVYSVFGQGADPPGPPASIEDGAVTLATTFVVAQEGQVTHLHFWLPDDATTENRTVGLYETTGSGTGTLLASATVVAPTPGAWNTHTLASPVTVEPGTLYKVATWHPANAQYPATGDYWATAGASSGPLQFPSDLDLPEGQGTYEYGSSITYPTDTFNETNYWNDLTLSVAAGVSRVLTLVPRTGADAAPAVDTVTSPLAQSRPVADSAPATDSPVHQQGQGRIVDDNAPATDSTSEAHAFTRTEAESAPAADAVTRTVVQDRAVADSVPAVDAAARSLLLNRPTSDTAGAADATTSAVTQARAVDDTAPATDALTRTVTNPRATSETASATDAATRAVQIFTRPLADSAPAVDTVSRSTSRARATAETAPSTDQSHRGSRLPYPATVLADAPEGYWRLEETGTGAPSNGNPAADSSGHDRTAGLVGPSGYTGPGDPSLIVTDPGGFSLDTLVGAQNGYLRVPYNSAYDTANWSIEVWFSGTDTTAKSLACRSQSGGRMYDVHLSQDAPGRVVLTGWRGLSTQFKVNSTADTYNDGRTHHVVGTYDGTTLRLYLDGVQQGSGLVVTGGALNSSAVAEIKFGQHDGDLSLDGHVDEAAVYSTVLSSGRIAEHYLAGTRLLHFARPVSDSAPAADAVARAVVDSRAVSETASATDAVTHSLVLPRPVADSAPAVDTLARSQALVPRTAADTAPATDATTHTQGQGRLVTDNAPATDTAARSAQAVNRPTSDSAPATDALTRAPLSRDRAVADSAPAVDSALAFRVFFKAVSDSAPATDAVVRSTSRNRAAADTAPATDAAARAAGVLTRATLGSLAAAADTAARQFLWSRAAADTAPATDVAFGFFAARPPTGAPAQVVVNSTTHQTAGARPKARVMVGARGKVFIPVQAAERG